MKTEVLCTLCTLSVTGAVLTLAVCALAPLARRFLPARWLKNAATLVLLAYALPVWLALPPLSTLLPEQPAPQAQDTPPAVAEPVQTVQAEPVQAAAEPEQAQPVPSVHDEAAAQPQPFPAGIVLAVWGAGAALLLCRTLVPYAVFRRRLKRQREPVEVCALLEICRAEAGVRRRVRLYRTGLVRAPALAGLMCPFILLPWGDFSAEDLHAALLHELHHLKSRDLARKWLAALVQCMHWWNPFAYLATRLLHRSCETACDLAVTGKVDSAGRTADVKTVRAFAAAGVKAPPLTTSMSAGGREIERRFIMIARQKPVKMLAKLTALALTACLLVSGLGVGALAAGTIAFGTVDITNETTLSPNEHIHVNGFSVYLLDGNGREVLPLQYQSTTYIPVRSAADWLGKNVRWDEASQTIYFEGSRTPVFYTSGGADWAYDFNAGIPAGAIVLAPERKLVMDGVQRQFYTENRQEIYPIVYLGTTYLPVRSIGELCGFEVGWYQTDYITTQSELRLNQEIFLRTPMTDAQKQQGEHFVRTVFDASNTISSLIEQTRNAIFNNTDDRAGIRQNVVQIQNAVHTMQGVSYPETPLFETCNRVEQLVAELPDASHTADVILAAIDRGDRLQSIWDNYISISYLENGAIHEGLEGYSQMFSAYAHIIYRLFYQSDVPGE